MGRHVQILQNKFAISLEYRTKELKDEVDFLHAVFLQYLKRD